MSMRTVMLSVVAALCVPVLPPSSRAQEPGAPGAPAQASTAADLFRAADQQIDLGHPEEAGRLLKQLVALKLPPEQLLELRDRFGPGPFMRLTRVDQTRDAGRQLLQQVTQAAAARAQDPKRINRMIALLSRAAEDRAFGIVQVRAAGGAAFPHLLAVIRDEKRSDEQVSVLGALPLIGRSIVPPLIATLDLDDDVLRTRLIEALGQIGDPRAAAFLWFFSADTNAPAPVSAAARAALVALMRQAAASLPSAKEMLLREAADYYYHRAAIDVLADGRVEHWTWDSAESRLVARLLAPSQVEELLGTRFAQEALRLDPTNRLAQLLLVSLTLDKAYERVGLDKSLSAEPSAALQVAVTAGPELLGATLLQALADGRTAVALGTVQALGQTGGPWVAQPVARPAQGAAANHRELRALVQALSYPDRRVQFAAADAILGLRPTEPFSGSERVVSVLIRALSSDGAPKALIADPDSGRANALASLLRETGLEPELAATGREALAKLNASSDYELILIDATIEQPTPTHLLSSLRNGAHTAAIPVAITGQFDVADALRKFESQYSAVRYVGRPTTTKTLQPFLNRLAAERRAPPLADAERAAYAERAITWLVRLAYGEMLVFDPLPAEAVLVAQTHSAPLAAKAIEALGLLRGQKSQQELADLVLRAGAPAGHRLAATRSLAASLRSFGRLLSSEQAVALVSLYDDPAGQPLRPALAAVIGALGPTPDAVGRRLVGYRPPPEAAAPAAPPTEPAPMPAQAPPAKRAATSKPGADAGQPGRPVRPPKPASP